MKKVIVFCLATFVFQTLVFSQATSVHMHRKVAPEDRQKYIEKEVKYWSKFAQEEVDKGNMVFWGVFERIGGENIETEPNFLIINTYEDIDSRPNYNHVFKMFPDVREDEIRVNKISSLTDVIYLRDLNNHTQAASTNPEKDFNIVTIHYHHSKNPMWHVRFERETVKPAFQKFMDEGKTILKGWGNALILSPKSKAFPYNSYSYNVYSSLGDALKVRRFVENPFPAGAFDEWQENHISEEVRIYRVIKVVSSN